ncbi:MAG: hypothetical protein ABW352_12795 [Polyangiales bacterium]
MRTGLDPTAEKFIQEACLNREFELAITRAFEAYGSEILSFLCARLRSRGDGEEAFSMFAEDLCQALPSFEFRCSVRGYLYTVARNAGNRLASQPYHQRERNLPVHESISVLTARARTETQAHQRTENKDRVRGLREKLDEPDQMLLILHVDRALPWDEIALIMHEQGDALEAEALARESARLRKRFERVKTQLRTLAKQEGLLK